MRAFKWPWAVPERSGDVPGSSRARIIDFSLVLEGLGGGEASGGPVARGSVRPPKTSFSRQTKHHRHRHRRRHRRTGVQAYRHRGLG